MAEGGIRFSPMIYDYLKKYQDDPTSRIFAPLAEAYRKSGLVDEAIEIAREGLRIHPQFIGGRVALARALFDKKHFGEVLDELTPVVREVPDNIVAQKLIAESCLMLGRLSEALAAYKVLLYFNPHDPEVAKLVSELESQAYEQGTLVLTRDPAPQKTNFNILPARTAIDSDEAMRDEETKRLEARKAAIRKVEYLTALLQNVEKYRSASSNPV